MTKITFYLSQKKSDDRPESIVTLFAEENVNIGYLYPSYVEEYPM